MVTEDLRNSSIVENILKFELISVDQGLNIIKGQIKKILVSCRMLSGDVLLHAGQEQS